MKMFRMNCKKTLRDGISYKITLDKTGGENIEKFLRMQRLQWFGLMERMEDERASVRAQKNCS